MTDFTLKERNVSPLSIRSFGNASSTDLMPLTPLNTVPQHFRFPVSNNGSSSSSSASNSGIDNNTESVTLQINNLDHSMDEMSLRNFLLNQLKPVTPVLSLKLEGSSAKIVVPNITFAKHVVANLHRKKLGYRRVLVSYSRDSVLPEMNTLQCQVAGLLKDIPGGTLPIYKFRELFQSRFKTTISVLDLYKMQDICTIITDKNDEKYIKLHADLVNTIENTSLMDDLQHTVPYCIAHFEREQHKGWAEQDIEPLPNVCMSISEIHDIIYQLLKRHRGDIPVTSLVYCISGELGIKIIRNENGVNLEHLISCVQGVQISRNNFGIKILGWLEPEHAIEKENGFAKENSEVRIRSKIGLQVDPLYQISREVIEVMKTCPKSTMKFDRFIPAYHNHFGKQCRVADYGYTKLVELFEALSNVIQIMGDGENRLITLTHRTQLRRFTSDLLRVIRHQGNKPILLSKLPQIFAQSQNRPLDITEYGVCYIVDILDGLVNSNIVVVTKIENTNDMMISIQKRKQTQTEIEKTCVFAGEVVELFRKAPQYSIPFQKFVRSYHYHFGYQCRLNDYGFLKLADLMEAIRGAVEIDYTNDEDKRIYLSPIIARQVFSEQLEALVIEFTGCSTTCIGLEEVLQMHKKKFGYQIQSQALGFNNIIRAIEELPFIELLESRNNYWIVCHFYDPIFRQTCYRSCIVLHDSIDGKLLTINDFISMFAAKYDELLTKSTITAMKHFIQIQTENNEKYVTTTRLVDFIAKLIRTLENRSMKIWEIKNALGLGLTDCFEFGFGNLLALIRNFPDIFIIEEGGIQEKVKISLAADNDCLGTDFIQNILSHRTIDNKLLPENKGAINKNKPEIRQRSIENPYTNNNNNNNYINNNNNIIGTKMAPYKELKYYSNKMVPPQQPPGGCCSSSNFQNLPNSSYNENAFMQPNHYHYHHHHNSFSSGIKDNFNSTVFNGSLNSSLSSDLNESYSNFINGNNISTNDFNQFSMAATRSFGPNISHEFIEDFEISGNNNNVGGSQQQQQQEQQINHSCTIYPPVSNFTKNIFQNNNNNISDNISSKIVQCEDLENICKVIPSQQQQQQQQNLSMPNFQNPPYNDSGCMSLSCLSSGAAASAANKENFNPNLNGFFNSAMNFNEIYGNRFINNNNNYNEHRLFARRGMNPTNCVMSMRAENYSNNGRPFWNNPIWTSYNNENLPKINSLNFTLPELSPFQIMPVIMSPYTMSKIHNNKNAFF